MVNWTALSTDGPARTGMLHTPHGSVATPCFMAVGTQGALKGIHPDQAWDVGQRVLLANTYHLALRPGSAAVAALGGLHRFAAWKGPMLTDSGGYQVFSLADRCKITESGVAFKSHLDGKKLDLTPESSLDIQLELGADIIMALDVCPAADAPEAEQNEAVAKSARWLNRAARRWRESPRKSSLFGIVQGGMDLSRRLESLALTAQCDLPGMALGGFAVGESAQIRDPLLRALVPQMPSDRPRYLMGVGTPMDLVEAVAAGIDMFDCVLPTRMGRHGIAYTDQGPIHFMRQEFALDTRPIDEQTPSPASAFTRGAIRHLLKAGELLGGQVLAMHNLAYYQRLMGRLQTAIAEGRMQEFLALMRSNWKPE